MNPVILTLVIAAIVGLGFLAMFAILLIAMRTEGPYLSPTSAPHTRYGKNCPPACWPLRAQRTRERCRSDRTLGGDVR